jgi:type VI protein secretion system component Hcp
MYKAFIKIDDMSFNRGQNYEISSFSWGPGRQVGTHPPMRSAPDVKDLTITCPLDQTSMYLNRVAFSGDSFNMTISFSKPIGRGWTPYMQIKLKDAMVTAFHTSAGGGKPMCSVSMTCSDLEMN